MRPLWPKSVPVERHHDWFVGQAAHIGKLLVYCGLMLLFSALLYWRGESHLRIPLLRNASGGKTRRCGGPAGRSGHSRAVALGVVVTALVQAVIGSWSGD